MNLKELKAGLEKAQTEKQKEELKDQRGKEKAKGCFGCLGLLLMGLVSLVIIFGLVAWIKLLFGYIF